VSAYRGVSATAAGSVVRGTVPDRCVVAGVPARVVREYVPGSGWKPPLRDDGTGPVHNDGTGPVHDDSTGPVHDDGTGPVP